MKVCEEVKYETSRRMCHSSFSNKTNGICVYTHSVAAQVLLLYLVHCIIFLSLGEQV